jgi:hypothetical protein
LGDFHVLDDEELIELFEWFDERDLVTLSLVSHVMYIFSDEEELWKALCIRKFVSKKLGWFTFKGTWKRTCLTPSDATHYRPYWKLAVNGFHSNRLYSKWFRAHIPLDKYATSSCDIDKRSNLSLQEFIDEYESKNKPVIITDAMDNWKAKTSWQLDKFMEKYGDTLFKTNGTDEDGHCFKLKMKDYFSYMKENHDDKPIYLFDNKFQQRAPDMLHEYSVPIYFQEDLFELMTDQDRPDYRWFLCGPPRSGSPLHQDPHRTSAWNALAQGRKRWTLYPPDVIPLGVDKDLIDTEFYASPDVMKYYLEVYPFLPNKQKPMEVIQEAGEVIFVPSGWWHQVLNLEATVAVTQNFCSQRNLKFVYQDMLDKKSSLRKHFYDAVTKRFPDLLTGFPEVMDESSSSDSSDSDD